MLFLFLGDGGGVMIDSTVFIQGFMHMSLFLKNVLFLWSNTGMEVSSLFFLIFKAVRWNLDKTDLMFSDLVFHTYKAS